MKRIWLIVSLSVALLVGVFGGYGYSRLASKPVAEEPTIAQLLTLVNAERARNGVAPLKEDVRLDASAQLKANDETAYNYFGHVSPHDGKHGYEYIKPTGISCINGSENLVDIMLWDHSADSAVENWINSPPHHAAMIDPKYDLTGFGISGGHVVEHFCQTP